MEGISPHVWGDLYQIYNELEREIPLEDEETWTIRAKTAMDQFTATYGYVNSVHVYEHMIIHHGLELQHLHRPLGRYSNQLAEKEHHCHKVSYEHHSFRNGARATSKKLVQSEPTEKLLIWSYLVKYQKPAQGVFHEVHLSPRGHGRKSTLEKKAPLLRKKWTPKKIEAFPPKKKKKTC